MERGADYASAHPPEFTFAKTPSNISASTTSVFEFQATIAGTSYTCSLNGQPFVGCASPLTYSNLPDGSYTLIVRANHLGATYDQTYTWFVDKTAPTVVISSSLTFINLTSGSVAFSSANQGPSITSFECKLDAAAYVPCNSPYVVAGLAQGSHTVQVRGRDSANNQSAAAILSFVVDTTLPAFTQTGGPAAGANYTCDYVDQDVALTFTVSDTGGSGLRSTTCKYDAGAEVACTSPRIIRITVADFSGGAFGQPVNHTMVIKVTDNAGNIRTVTHSFQYSWYDCNPTYNGGGGP